jgi:DNA polymerase-1
MKRLLIIDGLNMFLRSYIINPTMDPKGIAIGGCIGFLKSLQKCVRDYDPSEVIIAWDGHGGSQKRRSMNKSYKEGRKPLRFNRRMIDLNPEDQEKNKAYQQIRTMQYVNELPVMQIMIDYVEADDVISYVVQHDKYKEYNKLIVSSDKDFYQLVDDNTAIFRPIQKKVITLPIIMEEFAIHPNNFALARAIAGDPSDNLKGVPRVGLKTVSKKFEFLSSEKEIELQKILEQCSKVEKQLQVHKNILKHESLIKNNYDIMQLYKPNIAGTNKRIINYSIEKFEFEYSKMNFTKLLYQDGQGSVNFAALYRICKGISATRV